MTPSTPTVAAASDAPGTLLDTAVSTHRHERVGLRRWGRPYPTAR
jgi:hypothetical protein